MLRNTIKHNLRIIIPILLAMCIVFTSVSVALFSILNNAEDNDTDNSNISNDDSNVSDIPVKTEPVIAEKIPLAEYKSISITPGKDFIIENAGEDEVKKQLKNIVETAKTDGFNVIELTLNYENGLMFSTEGLTTSKDQYLIYLSSLIKVNGMKLISAIDLKLLAENNITDTGDIEKISKIISNEAIGKYSDMLILKNCYVTPEQITEEEYKLTNSTVTYEEYINFQLNEAVTKFYIAAAKSRADMPVGIEINKEKHPKNAIQNVKEWIERGIVDFVDLYNPYSTTLSDVNFKSYYESVLTELGIEKSLLHCRLAYEKIGSKEKGWEQTDQILKQLKELDALEVTALTIDSYNSFVNDKTESRNAVKKYFADMIAEDYILRELSVSKPSKNTFTTTDKTVLLSGASDPEFALTLNGKALDRTELGYFSTDLELKDGLNTFKLEHKGISKTFKITFKRTIIKEVSPTEKTTLQSASVLLVKCTAIKNSTVTATLGEMVNALTEEPIYDENGEANGEYSNYTGRITFPTVYDEDASYGKITFTAKSQYGTESKYSGNIIVIKEERPVPPSSSNDSSSNTSSSGSTNAPTGGEAWTMPSNGSYVDVGNKYIAEVTVNSAQTFSYGDSADYSRPTNTYLPKGTVDYCSNKPIVLNSSISLQTLRYGKLLYAKHKGPNDIKVYEGTLPDHQSINVAGVNNTGRHTQITLDVLWKAPFTLALNDQKYVNDNLGENRDFTLKGGATFKYVDITFSYTTLVAGEVLIPESDPVFSKAEWIKNSNDYTLRLHLKKTGVFYGWSAEYNNNNQLVFSFLNPAKIKADTNHYGYRLDGIIIAVDPGHGGSDGGATGNNNKKEFNEANLNLKLAKMVKAELESLGATVIMTRSDDIYVSSFDRKNLIREKKPDFTLSIHRNHAGTTKPSQPRGFSTYYFNAFSYNATNIVYDATKNANLYKPSKWSRPQVHRYFYTTRTTECPSVLTENGFMSNSDEFSQIIRDDFNQKCAVALTQGIVDYFKSIQ